LKNVEIGCFGKRKIGDEKHTFKASTNAIIKKITNMEYSNLLKGRISETIIDVLLKDAGYHVIPLGIESTIREITLLDHKDYSRRLKNFRDNLRTLPDFLITTKDLSNFWLVEIKYRKKWDKGTQKQLGKDLMLQARCWSPLLTVILLGEPCCEAGHTLNSESPSQRIRVAKTIFQNEKLSLVNLNKTFEMIEDEELPDSIPWGEKKPEAEWHRCFGKFDSFFSKLSINGDKDKEKTMQAILPLIDLLKDMQQTPKPF
jgi:hypothetical protein